MDNCKPTEQNRRVYCMSDSNKRAASRMCVNVTMPVVKRNCSISHCPYQWVAGPWSTVGFFKFIYILSVHALVE